MYMSRALRRTLRQRAARSRRTLRPAGRQYGGTRPAGAGERSGGVTRTPRAARVIEGAGGGQLMRELMWAAQMDAELRGAAAGRSRGRHARCSVRRAQIGGG